MVVRGNQMRLAMNECYGGGIGCFGNSITNCVMNYKLIGWIGILNLWVVSIESKLKEIGMVGLVEVHRRNGRVVDS